MVFRIADSPRWSPGDLRNAISVFREGKRRAAEAVEQPRQFPVCVARAVVGGTHYSLHQLVISDAAIVQASHGVQRDSAVVRRLTATSARRSEDVCLSPSLTQKQTGHSRPESALRVLALKVRVGSKADNSN